MAEAIESTYFDTCDVYRMDKVKQPNGSYKQQRTKIYTALSCALNVQTRPTYSDVTETLGQEAKVTNTVRHMYKVYMNPSHIIQQGDQLIITHLGRTVDVKAGYLFVYDSHQLIEAEDNRSA